MGETERFYLENSELRDYYNSLEPAVRSRILSSDAVLSTVGELKLCVENLRKNIGNTAE